MAKTRMKDEEIQPDSKKIMVKAFLSEDEHRILRHAAAEKSQSISDYIKEVTLIEAQKVIEEFVKNEMEKINKK